MPKKFKIFISELIASRNTGYASTPALLTRISSLDSFSFTSLAHSLTDSNEDKSSFLITTSASGTSFSICHNN